MFCAGQRLAALPGGLSRRAEGDLPQGIAAVLRRGCKAGHAARLVRSIQPRAQWNECRSGHGTKLKIQRSCRPCRLRCAVTALPRRLARCSTRRAQAALLIQGSFGGRVVLGGGRTGKPALQRHHDNRGGLAGTISGILRQIVDKCSSQIALHKIGWGAELAHLEPGFIGTHRIIDADNIGKTIGCVRRIVRLAPVLERAGGEQRRTLCGGHRRRGQQQRQQHGRGISASLPVVNAGRPECSMLQRSVALARAI